ncbi:MAG: A/G-specific adenine glycosylase [Planctomycetota bacterium]
MGRPQEVSPPRLARRLLAWYDAHRRDLPWRDTPDPYRVWVSEVMLQQTQVATVLAYYAPFLARFPDVGALAQASEDAVLAAWSGLGFYRRARNLHQGARYVAAELDGRLPTTLEGWLALPGVGRYTAGAVCSIALGIRAPIVDGNVGRVLSRLHAWTEHPSGSQAQRRLWATAEALLPEERVGDFNQALMELGATVCRPRQPACLRCPWRDACAARASGDPHAFPQPKRQQAVPRVERVALWLERPDGRWLMTRRPGEGLLANMWELPSSEVGAGSPSDAARRLARAWGTRRKLTAAGAAEHRFSHLLWHTQAFRAAVPAGWEAAQDGRWVQAEDLGRLGLPTASKKVLAAARQ